MVRISGMSGLAKGDRDSSLTVDCLYAIAFSMERTGSEMDSGPPWHAA